METSGTIAKEIIKHTKQQQLHLIVSRRTLHIHTGGGLIKSHFWFEILLKLDYQIIQIKALVCDSECPYDLILGHTSMAQLSAWQDYMSHKLYLQQISIPLMVRNNIHMLPGKTGIVSLTL